MADNFGKCFSYKHAEQAPALRISRLQDFEVREKVTGSNICVKPDGVAFQLLIQCHIGVLPAWRLETVCRCA